MKEKLESILSSSGSLRVGQILVCIIPYLVLKKEYLRTKEVVFQFCSAGGLINLKQIQPSSVTKPHLELNTILVLKVVIATRGVY